MLLKLRNVIFTVSLCLWLPSSGFCQVQSLVCCMLCMYFPIYYWSLLTEVGLLHALLNWFLSPQLPPAFFCMPGIALVDGSFHILFTIITLLLPHCCFPFVVSYYFCYSTVFDQVLALFFLSFQIPSFLLRFLWPSSIAFAHAKTHSLVS